MQSHAFTCMKHPFLGVSKFGPSYPISLDPSLIASKVPRTSRRAGTAPVAVGCLVQTLSRHSPAGLRQNQPPRCSRSSGRRAQAPTLDIGWEILPVFLRIRIYCTCRASPRAGAHQYASCGSWSLRNNATASSPNVGMGHSTPPKWLNHHHKRV